jgi:hypothetical protein
MSRMNVYNLTQPAYAPGFEDEPNKWIEPFATDSAALPSYLGDTVTLAGHLAGGVRTGYITAVAKYLDQAALAPGKYRLFVTTSDFGMGRLVDIDVPDPQPATILSSPGSLA